MTKVRFPYVDRKGKTKTLDVNDSATRIDFSNKGIVSIDISPIRQCLRLRDFLIYNNELTGLDLSPLSNCNLLRQIVLRKNKLRSLDLSPLAELMELKRLDLRENQIQELNVDSLANHQMLEKFQVDGNPLLEIDISALLTCRDLKDVGLDRHMKLKAARKLQEAVHGPFNQYKKRIIWFERTKEAAPQASQSGPMTAEKVTNMTLGVLRAVPRITMEDLTEYTGLTVDETRELVFLLVGEGKIVGRFDSSTDEFVSLQASKTIKELRSDATVVQKCQHCGNPLPRRLLTGDRVRCDACGMVNEA